MAPPPPPPPMSESQVDDGGVYVTPEKQHRPKRAHHRRSTVSVASPIKSPVSSPATSASSIMSPSAQLRKTSEVFSPRMRSRLDPYPRYSPRKRLSADFSDYTYSGESGGESPKSEKGGWRIFSAVGGPFLTGPLANDFAARLDDFKSPRGRRKDELDFDNAGLLFPVVPAYVAPAITPEVFHAAAAQQQSQHSLPQPQPEPDYMTSTTVPAPADSCAQAPSDGPMCSAPGADQIPQYDHQWYSPEHSAQHHNQYYQGYYGEHSYPHSDPVTNEHSEYHQSAETSHSVQNSSLYSYQSTVSTDNLYYDEVSYQVPAASDHPPQELPLTNEVNFPALPASPPRSPAAVAMAPLSPVAPLSPARSATTSIPPVVVATPPSPRRQSNGADAPSYAAVVTGVLDRVTELADTVVTPSSPKASHDAFDRLSDGIADSMNRILARSKDGKTHAEIEFSCLIQKIQTQMKIMARVSGEIRAEHAKTQCKLKEVEAEKKVLESSNQQLKLVIQQFEEERAQFQEQFRQAQDRHEQSLTDATTQLMEKISALKQAQSDSHVQLQRQIESASQDQLPADLEKRVDEIRDVLDYLVEHQQSSKSAPGSPTNAKKQRPASPPKPRRASYREDRRPSGSWKSLALSGMVVGAASLCGVYVGVNHAAVPASVAAPRLQESDVAMIVDRLSQTLTTPTPVSARPIDDSEVVTSTMDSVKATPSREVQAAESTFVAPVDPDVDVMNLAEDAVEEHATQPAISDDVTATEPVITEERSELDVAGFSERVVEDRLTKLTFSSDALPVDNAVEADVSVAKHEIEDHRALTTAEAIHEEFKSSDEKSDQRSDASKRGDVRPDAQSHMICLTTQSTAASHFATLALTPLSVEHTVEKVASFIEVEIAPVREYFSADVELNDAPLTFAVSNASSPAPVSGEESKPTLVEVHDASVVFDAPSAPVSVMGVSATFVVEEVVQDVHAVAAPVGGASAKEVVDKSEPSCDPRWVLKSQCDRLEMVTPVVEVDHATNLPASVEEGSSKAIIDVQIAPISEPVIQPVRAVVAAVPPTTPARLNQCMPKHHAIQVWCPTLFDVTGDADNFPSPRPLDASPLGGLARALTSLSSNYLANDDASEVTTTMNDGVAVIDANAEVATQTPELSGTISEVVGQAGLVEPMYDIDDDAGKVNFDSINSTPMSPSEPVDDVSGNVSAVDAMDAVPDVEVGRKPPVTAWSVDMVHLVEVMPDALSSNWARTYPSENISSHGVPSPPRVTVVEPTTKSVIARQTDRGVTPVWKVLMNLKEPIQSRQTPEPLRVMASDPVPLTNASISAVEDVTSFTNVPMLSFNPVEVKEHPAMVDPTADERRPSIAARWVVDSVLVGVGAKCGRHPSLQSILPQTDSSSSEDAVAGTVEKVDALPVSALGLPRTQAPLTTLVLDADSSISPLLHMNGTTTSDSSVIAKSLFPVESSLSETAKPRVLPELTVDPVVESAVEVPDAPVEQTSSSSAQVAAIPLSATEFVPATDSDVVVAQNESTSEVVGVKDHFGQVKTQPDSAFSQSETATCSLSSDVLTDLLTGKSRSSC